MAVRTTLTDGLLQWGHDLVVMESRSGNAFTRQRVHASMGP